MESGDQNQCEQASGNKQQEESRAMFQRLIRAGDEMNAHIRKLECELKSLRSELKMMNDDSASLHTELRRASAQIEALQSVNKALLDQLAFARNGQSEMLRDQANAWLAVCKQLRGDNAYDLALPPDCSRNEAVLHIQGLQRKAAILDKINAGDYR